MESNELLDRRAACAFFGGVRPIHFATLYRGGRRASGSYPKPVRVAPKLVMAAFRVRDSAPGAYFCAR